MYVDAHKLIVIENGNKEISGKKERKNKVIAIIEHDEEMVRII